jgi:hypothetical protein
MIGNLHLLRRVAPVAVLAALAVIPTQVVESLPVTCVWRTWLHLECPGCGMTRALSSALHGHLDAALAYNRGVVLVLPAALMVVVGNLQALGRREVMGRASVIVTSRSARRAPVRVRAERSVAS